MKTTKKNYTINNYLLSQCDCNFVGTYIYFKGILMTAKFDQDSLWDRDRNPGVLHAL